MTLFIPHDKVDGGGLFIRVQAGEDVSDRKVVYVDTDGTWKLAKASAGTTMPGVGLTMHAIESGKYGWVLIRGIIGLTSWSWTRGSRLYVSEDTAGEMTHTSPTEPAEYIQDLGYAESATQIFFSPRQLLGKSGATYTKTVTLMADAFGKPQANVPTIVDKDNLTLYAFTVDTDIMTLKLAVPLDYASGGLKFRVVWTNDGGADDSGKNVRAQFDYQAVVEGDAVNGSHANSPKNVNDVYPSATGWIENRSAYVTIAEADFTGKECIYVKVSFVTAPATAMTGDPHLIGVCLQYTAYAFA